MDRALVIRLSALGDVVLVEPVIRALTIAGLNVDLVTDLRYVDLALRLGASGAVGFDPKGADAGASGLGRVRSRLPAGRYAVVVDLQGKLRTRLLARGVPAGRRLTLRKRSPSRAIRSLFGHDPPIHDRHGVDLYLGVLAPLGIRLEGEARAPRMARPDVRARAPGCSIGLCPGATHATKRWRPDRFAELADRLAERVPSARFALVGGPSDRALLETIRAASSVANFLGDDLTSLGVGALADRIAELDLLIGVDTGPVHIARALGVPTVTLYGPTSRVRWGPIAGPHHAVSLDLDCAPCSNFGGRTCPLPEKAHACMQDLEVTRVLESALRLLPEPRNEIAP